MTPTINCITKHKQNQLTSQPNVLLHIFSTGLHHPTAEKFQQPPIVSLQNSLAFVTLCLNLDGQLCRDLNPGARGVVGKHLPTRPRSLSTGYS